MPGNLDPREVEKMLNKMFAPEWLREAATRVKYVQRQRKVDPVILFWILVLGFGTGVQRTIASLRRAYKTASAESIVESAFYGRFSTGLLAFLKECIAHGVADLASNASLALSDKLAGFKDIVVSDGTIIKLHDTLAEKFPGARHKAELKINLVTGLTGNTKSIGLFSGKTAELKTIRIGPWVKDNILLCDLGFFKYEMFSRIRKNGGHFVSRLKTGVNPTIVSVLRTYRGNAIDLSGKKLQDVLPLLKRGVIDILIEAEFKVSASRAKKAVDDQFETYRSMEEETKDDDMFEVYHPRGGTTKIKETFRLIGVFDKETEEYHLYLTDITPDQLSAEDVALLYRARWSVEMVFKELKRLYKLDTITTEKPIVIECLVLVAMLTLVVSHRVLNHVRSFAPEKSERFTPLRWAELFYSSAPRLMDRVLNYAGIDIDSVTMMLFYMGEGIDPNVNRERLMTPWVKPNCQLIRSSN
jgi:IS4 transposase